MWVLRLVKCKKGFYIVVIVFGFVCIGGCFVFVSFMYILFGDCEGCEIKLED